MTNSTYDVELLVSDEKFQHWVLNGKQGAFVSDDSIGEDELSLIVDEAAAIVMAMRPRKKEISGQVIDSNWDQLVQDLDLSDKSIGDFQEEVVEEPSRRWSPYKYAAVIALIGLGLVFVLFQRDVESPSMVYETGPNDKKLITLVDGTEVNLNRNTRLEVWNQKDEGATREVWLEGEGFFHVTKKNEGSSRNFIVHSGGLDVEVLGTEFNVLNNGLDIHVALKSGKVKLSSNENGSFESKFMVPGEVITYSSSTAELELNTKNQHHYYAWLDDQIILDNTTIEDIGELIKSRFGKNVMVDSAILKSKTLSGVIPDNDLKVLLDVIRNSLEVQVTEDENGIQIF